MTSKTIDHNHHAPKGVSATLAVYFAKFAQATASWTGHPIAFLLAVAVVIVWVVTGPVFNYSDTWQLVINTGTTIVTFLMVFLIQNTQNRDMLAVQLKLSELVLAMKGAENKFAAIEDLSDEELQALHDDCRERAEITGDRLENRQNAKRSNGNGAHKAQTTAPRASKPARRAARQAANS